MKTSIAIGILAALVCVVGLGCQQSKPVEKPLPPPPPKVDVTLPDGNLGKDEEGVRRIAVSLPWERQSNGRVVGKGFSSQGMPANLELSRALDEVVQVTVESAFKELGFNVTATGGFDPTSSEKVRTELERLKADYLVVPTINEFLVSTMTVPDAPAFGTVSMEVQVFGPRGGLMTVVMVSVRTAWQLQGEKPGPEQLRPCVEALLKEIRRQIVNDPVLLKDLGLELPAAAATMAPAGAPSPTPAPEPAPVPTPAPGPAPK